jgi:hypothetical protein
VEKAQPAAATTHNSLAQRNLYIQEDAQSANELGNLLGERNSLGSALYLVAIHGSERLAHKLRGGPKSFQLGPAFLPAHVLSFLAGAVLLCSWALPAVCGDVVASMEEGTQLHAVISSLRIITEGGPATLIAGDDEGGLSCTAIRSCSGSATSRLIPVFVHGGRVADIALLKDH